MKTVASFALLLLLGSRASADPITVALAGDSLTACYQYYTPYYWNGTGYDVRYWDGSNYVPPFLYAGDPPPSSPWAISGQNARHFAGLLPISELGQPAAYHDQGREIADLNPNFVWFMLGTNDSTPDYTAVESFDDFKANIDYAFSQMAGVKHVIVASILPKVHAWNASSDWRITNWYNPYLHAAAYKYGFHYLDLNYALRTKPDMADYYYVDGLHLSDWPGYGWLARSFADETKRILVFPSDEKVLTLSPGESLTLDSCIVDRLTIGAGAALTIAPSASGSNAVPEPSAFALLALGAVGLLLCAWQRRMRAS